MLYDIDYFPLISTAFTHGACPNLLANGWEPLKGEWCRASALDQGKGRLELTNFRFKFSSQEVVPVAISREGVWQAAWKWPKWLLPFTNVICLPGLLSKEREDGKGLLNMKKLPAKPPDWKRGNFAWICLASLSQMAWKGTLYSDVFLF